MTPKPNPTRKAPPAVSSPAPDQIYMPSPDIIDLEHHALDHAIQSGWVTPLGPEVDAFETEVVARTNRTYAVALSSGTAALHLGLLALGVGPGDTVITSTMTFVTANAIVYTGATPFFVASASDGNMDLTLLADALQTLTTNRQKVGAIIPVDLLDKVASYPAIAELAAQYGIPVLADAAESFGASLNNQPADSFGEAAIFSFNGNKIMTTSSGVMFLTDNKAPADKVRYLATQARQPVAHYEHTDIGYNYHLSNLLAALGRAQLARLERLPVQPRPGPTTTVLGDAA